MRRGFSPASGGGNAGNPYAEFLAQARLGGQPQPNKTRRDSGRAVYGAGEPLRLTALSRSHRPRRQREKYSRRNRHDAGRRG